MLRQLLMIGSIIIMRRVLAAFSRMSGNRGSSAPLGGSDSSLGRNNIMPVVSFVDLRGSQGNVPRLPSQTTTPNAIVMLWPLPCTLKRD